MARRNMASSMTLLSSKLSTSAEPGWTWYTEAAELMPSLQSYWLVIHVTVAVIAIAIFFIGAVTGILYLAHQLKPALVEARLGIVKTAIHPTGENQVSFPRR